MSLPPLPMTVVGGYLGAGKTTLINRLLNEAHGLRLFVMVNDFGAINIDAGLLAAAGEDTLELSNGCVCCTMGADLFMAIGRVLDRTPRPDHLVIEASGIADPARIANAAVAEPDLSYAGIVTVVDAGHFPALADDPQIGPQIRAQVAEADLLAITKTDKIAPELAARLAALSAAPQVPATPEAALGGLLQPLAAPGAGPAGAGAPHPAYASWSVEDDTVLSRAALEARLARRPPGLFRLKGWVRGPAGGPDGFEVQAVGRQAEIRDATGVDRTRLVGIALAAALSRDEIAAWWAAPAG